MTSQPCKLRQLPTAQRGVQAQRCCAIERDAVLRVVRDEDAADMDAAHERVSAQPPPCLDWKRLLVPSMDAAAAAEAQSCRALSKFVLFVKLRLGTPKLRIARRDLSNGTLDTP
jgi:hypothetical protein